MSFKLVKAILYPFQLQLLSLTIHLVLEEISISFSLANHVMPVFCLQCSSSRLIFDELSLSSFKYYSTVGSSSNNIFFTLTMSFFIVIYLKMSLYVSLLHLDNACFTLFSLSLNIIKVSPIELATQFCLTTYLNVLCWAEKLMNLKGLIKWEASSPQIINKGACSERVLLRYSKSTVGNKF